VTTPALVKSADLKRMANIAKRENVTVWVEIDGRRFGVSPDIQDINRQKKVDLPDDFAL
jgi:hypothetical protein